MWERLVSPGRKSIHCPMTFLQVISMYVHIEFYLNEVYLVHSVASVQFVAHCD